MSQHDPVSAAWRAHRAYLVDLAFRMVGDIGVAEDMVQEAFSRLLRAPVGDIDDERGWLIVVTSRLCLDHIKSASTRRERPQDIAAWHDGDASVSSVDPADRVTLDDEVRLALLIMLERLGPAERVVWQLRDLTLVAHDLGGPAGFLAAARRGDRVAALAAVNCFAWRPTGPLFRGMLAAMGSAPVRELDAAINALARATSTRFGAGRHWSRADRAAFRAGIDAPARRAWHAYFRDARRAHALYTDVDAALRGGAGRSATADHLRSVQRSAAVSAALERVVSDGTPTAGPPGQPLSHV